MQAAGASAVAATGLGLGLTGSASAAGINLPPLARDGNKIVDPSGNEIILRGVNIADPGEQSRADIWRGWTADQTLDLALDTDQGWYNRIVRIPIQAEFIAAGVEAPMPEDMPHGDDWGPLLPGEYDASDVEWYCDTWLDDLIDQCAEMGAYAMIDYHRHYPVFHQEDHKGHDIPEDIWQCTSDGGEDWRHPEVCGERGLLWHGEDQVDDIMGLVDEQNIIEAFDLSEDDIYTEPAEVSNALDDELTTFWETMADRYAGEDHVVFDVYNEPTGPYGGDWGGPARTAGALSQPDVAPGDAEGNYDVAHHQMKAWYDLWKDRSEKWVNIVEENAPGHLVTIGSPRWSQYTYWAPFNEYEDVENMCYTAHVYTQDDMRPLTKYIGQPSEHVPVFFSEFGWIKGGGEQVDTPWMDCTGEFGQDEEVTDADEADCQPYIDEYTEFLDEYDVQAVAWCFDHSWEPFFFDPEAASASLNQGESWQEYLTDRGPGEWWHERVQEMEGDRDNPEEGSQYGDGDAGPNSLHVGGESVDDPEAAYEEGEVEDGDDTPEDCEDGMEVGDNCAMDGDDDGLYEDVDGSGDAGANDVVTFFEEFEGDAVQDNADAFDFNGSGSVGFDDVIELFNLVN